MTGVLHTARIDTIEVIVSSDKFITTHDDFDSVDPSSMQDACHIWTQLIITTHDDFDSVDPSSMQDACHIWTQLIITTHDDFNSS